MKANHSFERALALSMAGAGLLLLGSCSERQHPAPAPAPKPTSTVQAPPREIVQSRPASDWRDRPATSGIWRWSRSGALSVSRFEDANFVRFSMTCDPAARTVTLRAYLTGGPQAAMIVTTPGGRKVLTAVRDETQLPLNYAASLSATDPWLDQMAFARGRFMIEGPELPALYLPSWPEVSRVIEDCR